MVVGNIIIRLIDHGDAVAIKAVESISYRFVRATPVRNGIPGSGRRTADIIACIMVGACSTPEENADVYIADSISIHFIIMIGGGDIIRSARRKLWVGSRVIGTAINSKCIIIGYV